MQKPHNIPALFGAFSLGALGLGLGACMSSDTEPPTGSDGIEIRHTEPVVTGSQFTCTGAWPSANTPCGYSWTSQAATSALAMDVPNAIELVLQRHPIPVDGGASNVYLKLKFADDGTINASAQEQTTSAGTLRVIETSTATAGFVDPTVTGRSPEARNAGKFSLTFSWGSISGTYDTAQ
jgi:hypothetical protein